jgi:hypothetical protein
MRPALPVTRVSMGGFCLKRRGAPDFGFGERFKSVLRRGAFGLEQCIVHRCGLADAMHLVAAHFKNGHAGEGMHLGAVTLNAFFHGLRAAQESLWLRLGRRE